VCGRKGGEDPIRRSIEGIKKKKGKVRNTEKQVREGFETLVNATESNAKKGGELGGGQQKNLARC